MQALNYRAIIVDDEKLVRDGLKNHFDWNRYSIDVAGYFEDGKQAWEYLKANSVDIIITDVRMAHMDGVTLARKASELYPDISILFISGYADITYLRSALKVEAVDYILKSIDLNELASTIERTIKKIKRIRSEKEKIQNMSRKLELSLPLLRRQILLGILRENDEDMLQELHSLDIPLNNNTWYCVIVLRLNPVSRWRMIHEMSEKERIQIGIKVEDVCSSLMSGKECIVCNDRFIEYILIVSVEQQNEDKLYNLSKKLQSKISDEYHLNTIIGISEAFYNLSNLHSAYMNACKAIEHGYVIEDNIPVSINKYGSSKIDIVFKKTEEQLKSFLLSGDFSAIATLLNSILKIISELPTKEEKENYLINLLLLPARVTQDMNIGIYSSWDSLLRQFLSCENMEEKEKMLYELYNDFYIKIKECQKPHDNSSIQKVVSIIDEKYTEQISVQSLSDMVNLTPAYLCVLFKQQMRMTVNEYITKVRMDKAKELLSQTPLHLYEVCYQVGYLSPAYFSRLFKKTTGQTPKEWRDTHRSQDGGIYESL